MLSHLLWPSGWHLTSEALLNQLALILSPTKKIHINLVVTLQTMQQLTILHSEECSHRSLAIEPV